MSSLNDGVDEKIASGQLYLQPTMDQLRSLWSSTERVAIIRTIAPWWRDVGHVLKFSQALLADIHTSMGEKGYGSCCESLFQRWLDGVGVQPATWATLLVALEDLKFFSLVKGVQSSLKEEFDYPKIEGATIISQKRLVVHPEKPLTFHWEGHGFEVHIPAGAIDRNPVTMCIQASLGGNCQLPDDAVLVSGVYWLSLHPPVKRFKEKVTISLQHCVSQSEDSTISFITAKCTQKVLPYEFKELPGGSFCNTSSASLEVDHFSAFGLSASEKESLEYFIRTYYVPKQLHVYEAHITLTQNKDLAMESVRKHYKTKKAEDGPSKMIELVKKEKNIKLDVCDEGWDKDGWRLCPLSSPLCLTKKHLDGYTEGLAVPAFQIELKMLESRSLEQQVGFIGVTPEGSSIVLTREPKLSTAPLAADTPSEKTPAAASYVESPPNLPKLLHLKVPQLIEDNYSSFGVFLLNDMSGSRVRAIEDECRGKPERIVWYILQVWLEGKGLPVEWKTLVDTLRDAEMNSLAEKIESASA